MIKQDVWKTASHKTKIETATYDIHVIGNKHINNIHVYKMIYTQQ